MILNVKLKNCYGIASLDEDIKFEGDVKTVAIYAPNARMKTSFTKTFSIWPEKPPNEIHEDLEAEATILRDGSDLDSKQICTYMDFEDRPPFNDDAVTNFLGRPELKTEYENTRKNILEAQAALMKGLKSSSGHAQEGLLPKDLIEAFSPQGQLVDVLTSEKLKDKVFDDSFPEFSEIKKYSVIFNTDSLKLLSDPSIKQGLKLYSEQYREIIENSPIFRAGQFEYYELAQVSAALDKYNFFKAGHYVVLTGKDGKPYREAKANLEDLALADLLKDAKKELFKKINARVKSNPNNRKFSDEISVQKTPSFLAALAGDIDDFRRRVWISYLKDNEALYKDFLDKYESSLPELKRIEKKANEQVDEWEKVFEIFKDRFNPPYTPKVVNVKDVALGLGDLPSIKYYYGVRTEPVDEDILLSNLSSGERKALYTLGLIFEFEARRKIKDYTIFVLDDIAASYDYYNKYAVIEYLKEMSEEDDFYLIILTHNFDFFRSIRHIFKKEGKFLTAIRSDGNVSFEEAERDLDLLFKKEWAENIVESDETMVACIPLARNLVEYTKSRDKPSPGNELYDFFNSLVHYKSNTNKITVDELLQKYNKIFENEIIREPKDDKKVVDVVAALAKKLNPKNGEELGLRDKLILAIAIRLQADKFMRSKWPEEELDDFSTDALVRKYKSDFRSDTKKTKLLEKVLIISQGNLHLNSFMYEPLVDVSGVVLKELYDKVKKDLVPQA
jgi:energy-coupling factor transporter ATP-binding protein EcfA2